MVREKSCGAVVFTRMDGNIRYLLIRSLSGVYGFPKGHMEQDETEMETARREVFEETGVSVKLIPDFRCEEEYSVPQKENTVKSVVYFLGEYCNQEFTYPKEELTDAVLADYETAICLLQFESNKRILKNANTFLLD